MNKKAISTVVATSLIVLITIAAVAIVWTAIIPMIRENAPASDACLGVPANVDIVSKCIQADGTLKLRVKQLDTSATIKGIQAITYEAGIGTTQTGTVSGLAKNIEADVGTLTANVTGSNEVAIAAIVQDGAGTKTCLASSKIALSACAAA